MYMIPHSIEELNGDTIKSHMWALGMILCKHLGLSKE